MKWLFIVGVSFFSIGLLKAQDSELELSFNEQKEHRVGLGIGIGGFGSNFAYFLSPHYAFRYHRHYFGFTPYYGNLSGLRKHQDVGVGLDYRLYPFKNRNATLLYFPVGVHFQYEWAKKSEKSAFVYKVGFGVETLLGKRFALSLDANFGIGQSLHAKQSVSETGTFGTSNRLSYYFLPVIRVSYRL